MTHDPYARTHKLTERRPMKTATAYVAAWYIDCPYCGEAISAEDGSHLHTIHTSLPESQECFSCGKQVRMPKKVRDWEYGTLKKGARR